MKVRIYGKEGCKFCERAKKHVAKLAEEGKVSSYEYIDYLKEGLTKDDLSSIVGEKVETVPQILVVENDKWVAIGGFTEFYIKYPTE